MNLKIGKKYRIKTYEEVKKDYPFALFNTNFFSKNKNKIIKIKNIKEFKIYFVIIEEKNEWKIYNVFNNINIFKPKQIRIEIPNKFFKLEQLW